MVNNTNKNERFKISNTASLIFEIVDLVLLC